MLLSCERVLIEASNRARLDLQNCQIGSKLYIIGSSIGKINGGCDGGGILIRHSGTTASVLNCSVIFFINVSCKVSVHEIFIIQFEQHIRCLQPDSQLSTFEVALA